MYKSLSKKGYYNIIKHKFTQLIIPTIIFSVFISLLKYNMLRSIIDSGWGIYWFTVALFTMCLIYITIVMVLRLLKINLKGKIASSILLITSLALFAIVRIKSDICPIIEFNQSMSYMPCFILGILAQKHNDYFTKLLNNNMCNGILIITYILLLCTTLNNDILEYLNLSLNQHIFTLIRLTCFFSVSYIGLYVFVSFFYKQNSYFEKSGTFSKILCFFGRRTLDIYMIHFFLLPEFSFDIREYFETYYNPVLEILIVGGISVGIMALSALIGEIIRSSSILSYYMLGVKK